MRGTAFKKLILGSLVTVFILSGLEVATAAEEPFVDSGRLAYGVYTDISTLDPAEAIIWYESMIVRSTHESLLKYNLKDYSFEPLLAESWERHEDGGTFHLRKGVKFHDGTEFNAEAVKFNWQRHMAINKAPATWLKDIKDVKVIDNYTVRIITEKNWAFLLDVLASHCVFLITSPTYVKNHATQEDPWAAKWLHSHTCGTGPYITKEWVPNQHVTMVRNKDYWKGWSGKHFSEVVYQAVPEVNARRMMLQKGELDIINDMAVEFWDELAADPNITLKIIPSNTEQYFTMNNAREPLKDKNLRWAIAYAIDYEACRQVCKAPNLGLLIGPDYKRDLKKAMEYKNKSAYAGKEVNILFPYVIGVAFHKKLALIVQDNLKDVGIKVTLQAQTWPAVAKVIFAGNAKDAADMYPYYAVPIIADPYGILYKILHSNSLKPGGSNLGYSNPKFDALLDQARHTIDKKKRMELYETAKKLAVDDAAYVWLLMYPWVAIHRNNIRVYPQTELLDRLANIFYFYDMYRE